MAEKKRTGTKGGKPRAAWDSNTEKFMRDIGTRIESLQADKGWSNSELGRRLSLSHAAIRRIEDGEQNWPIAYLPRIAEVFGVEVSELIPNAESIQQAPALESASVTTTATNPEPPFT